MHTATDNIIRLVKDRYAFSYPELKEDYPSLPADFYNDMVIVFQDPSKFEASTFEKYPISLILDYLRITHRFYIEKRLGEIEQAIEKLKTSNNELVNEWYPCLIHFMGEFGKDMIHHIMEEEENLFPYVDELLKARENKVLNYTTEQKICLLSFMLDHDDVVEKELHDLVESLSGQLEKFNDSFSFRMLLNHMRTFELDLRIHARMEEEVLIPRSIVLEKGVLNDSSIRINPGF